MIRPVDRPLHRRTLLRSAVGTALALPWLEAMAPRLAAAEPTPPKRAVFVYIPNGVNVATWFPRKTGSDFDLPPALEPLAPIRDDVLVCGGLDRTYAGGTGVHAQCGACWLSGSPPDRPRDGGFPTDVSVDQLLAAELGRETRLPSLELSCNDHADGKETKYFESVSWLAPGFAASVEKNPRAVFDRLFGTPDGDPQTRSVLDAVREDAADLHRKLGRDDRRKLDEYFASVRATEVRIARAERGAAASSRPPLPRPAGIPADRGEYIRLMFDLISFAFRLDLTRVATLVVDPERWDSPRFYHGLFDTPQNHHVLTHTKGPEAKEKLTKIDRFHTARFAEFVTGLKNSPEGGGSVLDSCAAVLGSGISDGDTHSYKDLPVLVAGRAGGAIRPGRYVNFTGERPLANLWLTLLHAYGVRRERFADSTGPLTEASG